MNEKRLDIIDQIAVLIVAISFIGSIVYIFSTKNGPSEIDKSVKNCQSQEGKWIFTGNGTYQCLVTGR